MVADNRDDFFQKAVDVVGPDAIPFRLVPV